MQTKNLIQAAANVVKITRLSCGDVVKIVESSSYNTDVYYGVVIDMLNNGEKTFIQIMRYKKEYSGLDCEIKTYKGDSDVDIFPTTIDEVKEYFDQSLRKLKQDISDDEKKLAQKKIGYEKAFQFVNMETSKKLTESSFKEISQIEYDELKREKSF